MRFFLLLAFAAPAAHAELYRWVDPQSGSVKFSNLPPPWYGDPAKARNAPKVDVIEYRIKPPPPPGAEAAKPKPAPQASSSVIADLEERWRELGESLSSFKDPSDFQRAGDGLRQQMEAYDAVRAELDRQDPAGAARRRAQEGTLMDRLKAGLGAAFSRK